MAFFRMRMDQGGPLGGAVFHINFGRKRRVYACSTCGYLGERQCDWKVRVEDGVYSMPVTCDRWLCQFCATPVGPNKDLCPAHVGPYKAWLAGRTNSVDGGGYG